MPVWTKFLEYPFDFPNGVNYVVGQSRWTTDWNFIQPVVVDAAGNYNPSTSTITFNLASAPSGNASLYLALASDFQGPLIVQVNGNNIAGSAGYFRITAARETKAMPPYVREFTERFPTTASTSPPICCMRVKTASLSTCAKAATSPTSPMYDYLRLELTGYVPPAPPSVTAYAGNGSQFNQLARTTWRDQL